MKILVLQDTTVIFLEKSLIETKALLLQTCGQIFFQLLLTFTSNNGCRK